MEFDGTVEQIIYVVCYVSSKNTNLVEEVVHQRSNIYIKCQVDIY